MDSSLLGPAASGLVAGAAVLVLPGLALVGAWQRLRRSEDLTPGDAAVAATALSLCLTGLVGVVLLGAGQLSPTAMAVPLGVLAVAGLVHLALALRRARPRHLLLAALVAVASAPLSASVLHGGYRPAQSYQWFYWGLGRQLSLAGGVPSHVLEWGREVRWQPDYLEFNLLGQAFLGLTPHLEDPLAVAVWRLPSTLLVVAMLLLVLRLWLPVLPAAAGVLTFVATTFFVETVGNNSPETLGIAFGLAAVRLAVVGVRRQRPGLLVLAAVTLALDVSVHGIAATVCGLLLLAAVAVELPRARLLRALPGLALAGLSGLVVLVAQGLAVQGRSSPLGDAANPGRSTSGGDPTFDFVQFSNGRFDEPVRRNTLVDTLTGPLPRADLLSWQWGWLVALGLLGLVAALVLRRTPAARAVLVAVTTAALLALVVLLFELRYDTYVPRHTGNARIAGYLPLVYAVLVAHGTLALGRLLARWKVPVQAAGAAVVVALVAVTGPMTLATMDTRPVLAGDGADALAWMRQNLPPGSRVVSNVATRGTVEFFTDAENPLEGRQPLIEDAGFLEAAITELRSTHEFLEAPAPGGLDRLGADYLLLARPRDLGSVLTYGGRASPGFADRAGLDTVWEQGSVRLLRTTSAPTSVDPVGPARHLGTEVSTALAVVVLSLTGAILTLRRQSSPRARRNDVR